MCGSESIYMEKSLYLQCYCEPKIFLKNKVYLKDNDDNNDDNETICLILKYM